ncbi:MAG: wax ester/triacylglycerol synthase domain-containing protein [Solirubrobacteraceae bacterium]
MDRPLSDEDLVILGLESDTVAGHTCKVLVLDASIDPERLREALASRLEQAPELSLRLGSVNGDTCWIPGEIDLSQHVVADPSDGPLDEAGLLGAVARVFERRLDRTRPLWRIDVIGDLATGGSALVWTIHHSLADGTTAMRIGREAIWVQQTDPTRPPDSAPRPARAAQQTAHRRSQELLTLAREAPHLWHRSPFAGRIDNRRSVAFASTDLGRLRQAAATACQATVNDAVLTVVGGGVRRWLEAHHDRLGHVRVKVPVSLHGDPAAHDSAQAGNRDSFFCLDVPVSPADPLRRLAAVRSATRIRKAEHDAERLDALMNELATISPRLRGFANRVLASPRAFALNVSNVPGPTGSVTVAGVPVRGLYSIAEIGERHALRAAVVSYDGMLRFGLCADPTLVGDVDSLAVEIEADAEELISAATP